MIETVNQARKILTDWLGEGGVPVNCEVAQARANVCLRCPMNYKGNWLWQIATSIAIQAQMQLRQTMQLHLDGEDLLGVCEACGCKLKLKVHVPFKHIYRHTPDETFAKYHDLCWQKTEYRQMTQENPS